MDISVEYETLFGDVAPPPTPEFLLEPSPTNLGSKSSQMFQKIREIFQNVAEDESNQLNEPNEFETKEWEEDFEYKADALRKMFQEAPNEELYVDLFGSLDTKCNLLLDKQWRATAKSFYDLEQYILKHDEVFLYTQKFDFISKDPISGEYSRNRRTYEALNGFICFVEDIDEVDAGNIQAVIAMILTATILPNYINLTGNGLHLYFIFDAFHDMKYSAWLMAKMNRTTRESERDVYVDVKQRMIKSFKGSSAKSDIQNHLAQPSRLVGSKTKNRNKRTILFKVSDTKHSVQHIAGLFGIDLPDDEDIRKWRKAKEAEWRRERKKRKDTTSNPASLQEFFGSDEPKPKPERTPVVDEIADDVVTGDVEYDNLNSKYRFSFEGLLQRILVDGDWEKDSVEYLIREDQRKVWEEKKARAATPAGQKLKVAQRRGLESQYKQFREYCRDVARVRKRADVLHIFWNHAPWYQNDQTVIQRDFDDLFDYCNSLHRTRKVTSQQYRSIVYGPRYHYTKETISSHLGVELTFTNKREAESKRNRDAKDSRWKRIYVICEAALENNPRCSWEALTNIVKSYGIDVSEKTLRTRPEIRELKARLRSQ